MIDADTAFCDAFIKAVYGAPHDHPALAALASQPGFAVYRNTILKACVEALAANHPAVRRLTGDDWFDAAALDYARGAPPACASLLAYGDGFPDFLERHEGMHGLPYLAGVARIDRLWMQSHKAADQDTLDAAALAGIAPERLGGIHLAPHASARWTWCATMPLASIWRANREPGGAAAPPDWRGEGVLLTRRDGVVGSAGIGAGAATFLDACAAGAALQDAAVRALAVEPALDLAATLAALLGAGAFRADESLNRQGDPP